MICANTEDSTPIPLLQSQLAMEAIHGSSNGVVAIFSRLIPKTSDLLTSFVEPISAFIQSENKSSIKNSKYRETVRKVRILPFASFQDVLVMVPEGFHGKLVDYLHFLNRTHNDLVGKASNVVLEYSDELAIFLNNVDHRKSLKNHQTAYNKIKHDREAIAKASGAFFKAGSSVSRVKLGSVISRFGDLDAIFSDAEKLETLHSQANLTELLSNVRHAVSLLDLIKDKLEKDPSMDVSGSMAQHISNGAYEIAAYVELVSVMCFNVEVALSSVQALSEQLNRITG